MREAVRQSAIVQHGACTSPSLLAKPDRDAIPGNTDRGLGGMPPLRPAVSACPLTIPHPAIACNRGNEKDRSRSSREGSGPGASGDTELFKKASNINGFQGGRVANNLYISPFWATVFQTAALFLYPNSSVVIRVENLCFLSPWLAL